MMPHPTLQIDAPTEMYTMSSQRVSHFIQPHEWAILRLGSGSSLFDWALGLLTGSLGFTQNLYCEIYVETPTNWDRFASMLFFGLLFSGAALLIVSLRKGNDFGKIVKEIDSRQPQPFVPYDTSHQPEVIPPGSSLGLLARALAEQKGQKL
jgi:hypothetical protein